MTFFGTDGIRGIPNQKLTVELMVKIGKALRILNNNKVVIATDTRISKDFLSYAVAAGAMAAGLDVLMAGICPTPALIYYVKKKEMTGIVITASHNPFYENGIKILNKGEKLSIDEEQKIEELIYVNHFVSERIGTVDSINILSEYYDYILPDLPKSKLKIGLDLANGATYETAKVIFSKITPNLTLINAEPTGFNINLNCGSTKLDILKALVMDNNLDLGFAFDGDGDRVICVDKTGKIIDGDLLIYILACYLKKNNMLKDNLVVLSVMSNLGIINAFKKQGITVIESPVGDKNILKVLKGEHLSIGGENSGHIIMPDCFPTGDGVLIATKIVGILEDGKRTIQEALTDVELYADSLTNIKVFDRDKVMTNEVLFKRIIAIKEELSNDCKIIVRPSGTENLIRLTVMAKTQEIVEKYQKELKELILNS